jgi:hypothetical protein
MTAIGFILFLFGLGGIGSIKHEAKFAFCTMAGILMMVIGFAVFLWEKMP